MADIFLGEFDVDILPPFVSNPFPVPTSVGIDLFTNISFDVQDQGGSSVDLDELNVTVDGNPAITAGVFQFGYSGTISPIAAGWSVVIDPDDALNLDSLIEVVVEAQDQASIPNIMAPYSWSFSTNEGLIVPPSLSSFPGNQIIQLQWSLPPPTQMLQELFQLVRSTDGFPETVDQGELVYEGQLKEYEDLDVVNGQRYYYTIFVIRRYVSGVPEYVPYNRVSSTTAVPRVIVPTTVVLKEYVPERGEFGVTANPIAHGALQKTWGRLEDGVRAQNDVFLVQAAREVRSPLRGQVLEVGELPSSSPARRLSYVEVVNDRGLVVRVSGFIPLPNIARGLTVVPGQIMGRTSSSEIEISCFKQPVANFGRRTVRPRNFFLTTEQRDGRR